MARKTKASIPPQDQADGSSAREQDQLLKMAVNLVSSYVSRNHVPTSDLTGMIAKFHAALAEAGGGTTSRLGESLPCR